MRTISRLGFVVMTLVAIMPLAFSAEYLQNKDLKQGFSCWHGDGEPAFLNPDGTEGQEGDKGVIPVLKLPLSKGQPRAIYQEYETRDSPTTQHVRLQVYASSDFKRSTFASDYSPEINWKAGSIWYWSVECVPNVDFWIRVGPGYLYKLANLKPGEWVTVDGRWDSPPPADDRGVYFFVPPGNGTVYLRNFSATP
jgi:hypothetical protein